MTVELNIKDFGLQGAIKQAIGAQNVEIKVAPSYSVIPFRVDWIVSDKQIKGIADVVANVDGDTLYFKWT